MSEEFQQNDQMRLELVLTKDLIHSRLKRSTCTTPKPRIPKIDSAYYYPKYDHIYRPQTLDIGPYHQKELEDYGDMTDIQRLKYTYLKRLLQRTNRATVDIYVTTVDDMYGQALECYDDEFAAQCGYSSRFSLFLIDGIFVIEFFRYFHFKSMRDENDDTTFRDERFLRQLHRDIVLLENQLPFFLLNELFNMTKTNDAVVDGKDLITLALGFFDSMVPYNLSVSGVWDVNKIDHLFGLRHDSLCLSFVETISSPEHRYISNWENIISALGLREAGIEFRTATKSNLMDIKFVRGVLIIPQLVVSHETESQFRNLIVYEQYFLRGKPRCVTDYTYFISCLIKTLNDVELLRSYGIISNRLGPDKEVCQLFTRLGLNTLLSSEFCYSRVFCNVNRHCRRRRNRWKAKLMKNYFNSPWSIISFVAASVLLILTLAQTIYTILGYYYR